MGEPLQKRFGQSSLPFLLKVLSVRKALSIQAHPDLELAKKLHAENPTVYKDPNHKPEMAIALTSFEVLCGFRSAAEVMENVQKIPELKRLVGDHIASIKENSSDKEKLKTVFSAVMLADKALVEKEIASLISRLSDIEEDKRSDLEKTILTIHESYPGDVGVICPYLLNHFTLNAGEAVFLGANEPHAYLFGDCVECMATSDNVVRAGMNEM